MPEADGDLLDVTATCAFIGGTRPIDPSTLWRNVKAGIFPKPVKVTRNSNRWVRAELVEALERRKAARNNEAAP